MIPKIIHYCWFGTSPLKQEYSDYIEEWGKLNPTCTIKEWNHTNIPSGVPYLEKALAQQRWANASNYVRLFALREEGGIYLDTDIKLLQPLDSLFNYNCFLGFESGSHSNSEYWVNNAIIGAIPNHRFIHYCEDYLLKTYDGTEKANLSAPYLTTSILKNKYNLKRYGQQQLEDITLFEKEVFYPLPFEKTYDKIQLEKYITKKSISVHLWERSWFSPSDLWDRIDAQNRFIDTHLSYIDQLESKLNSTNTVQEQYPYTFYRSKMFTGFQNTLEKVQQHMNFLQDHFNTVQESTAEIKANMNNKTDTTGIAFGLTYLSSRLQEVETRLNTLAINFAISENNVNTKIATTEAAIIVLNKNKLEQEVKLKELDVQILNLTTSVSEHSISIADLSLLGKICDTNHSEETPLLNNENTSTAELHTHVLEEPGSLNLELLLQNETSLKELENENSALTEQVKKIENALTAKADENELLKFRLNSLSEYIDTSARVKQQLEVRIILLEDLIQKMRLKNRVKRVLGLYK